MATEFEKDILPLEAGDRMNRTEFLRRWELHSEIKNAELIGGLVYMASPVTADHGDMDSEVGGWLYTYKSATPGTASGHNATSLLLDDAPQPDVNLRILPDYGGGSYLLDRLIVGVPELLAEICRSSVSYDLHVRLDLYQAAKVPEYLAVLLYEREVRWHVLVDGKYRRLDPDADGILRSRMFPGLWLEPRALLAGESARVLKVLQAGLQSQEHERFIAELASRKRGHA